MKLYSYWRSTTSFRLRAALNLKGIDYKTEAVDLVTKEQASQTYLPINPSVGVPSLQLDGVDLAQFPNICRIEKTVWPFPKLRWPIQSNNQTRK